MRKIILIITLLLPLNLFAGENVKNVETPKIQKEDYQKSLEFPPLLNRSAWANVYASNISIGDIIIDFREDEKNYRIEAHVISSGIVKTFTKYRSRTIVSGIKKNGRYIPQKFENKRRLRKKVLTITMEYDENGKMIKDSFNPKSKRNKYPAVSSELRDYNPDPLTALFVARQHAFNAIKSENKKFVLPLYDGRHLSNVYFKMGKKEKVRYKRRNKEAYKLLVEQEPVAGFRKKDLKTIAEQDPTIKFYLYGEDLMPIMVEGDSEYGTAKGEVKKLCSTLESCFKKYND